jgi:hypothetical protein
MGRHDVIVPKSGRSKDTALIYLAKTQKDTSRLSWDCDTEDPEVSVLIVLGILKMHAGDSSNLRLSNAIDNDERATVVKQLEQVAESTQTTRDNSKVQLLNTATT